MRLLRLRTRGMGKPPSRIVRARQGQTRPLGREPSQIMRLSDCRMNAVSHPMPDKGWTLLRTPGGIAAIGKTAHHAFTRVAGSCGGHRDIEESLKKEDGVRFVPTLNIPQPTSRSAFARCTRRLALRRREEPFRVHQGAAISRSGCLPLYGDSPYNLVARCLGMIHASR